MVSGRLHGRCPGESSGDRRGTKEEVGLRPHHRSNHGQLGALHRLVSGCLSTQFTGFSYIICHIICPKWMKKNGMFPLGLDIDIGAMDYKQLSH